MDYDETRLFDFDEVRDAIDKEAFRLINGRKRKKIYVASVLWSIGKKERQAFRMFMMRKIEEYVVLRWDAEEVSRVLNDRIDELWFEYEYMTYPALLKRIEEIKKNEARAKIFDEVEKNGQSN